jgi:DNA-directed RNA polymerase subunit alpha
LRQGPALALDNGGGPGGAMLPTGGQRGGGPMDDILIEELELGVRSYNCLKRAGIQTVGDLVSKSEGELAAIPNFGKKSIDEVIETLNQRGLGLRSD